MTASPLLYVFERVLHAATLHPHQLKQEAGDDRRQQNRAQENADRFPDDGKGHYFTARALPSGRMTRVTLPTISFLEIGPTSL